MEWESHFCQNIGSVAPDCTLCGFRDTLFIVTLRLCTKPKRNGYRNTLDVSFSFASITSCPHPLFLFRPVGQDQTASRSLSISIIEIRHS